MTNNLARIPVFFDARMVADAASFSPSAGKPAAVVADWSRRFPIEVLPFDPVDPGDLELAHHPRFVRDVLDCRRENGFGNTRRSVAMSLPFTTGAMAAAAAHALDSGIAAAPCSGFHHARYAAAEGFCTFNGLIVAARMLERDRGIERVGILDCDFHYGNGTDEIIDCLRLGESIEHHTAGKQFHRRADPARFTRWLRDALAALRDCDVVLYQAGADPHIDDPFGGFLTDEQLAERDRIVFETLRECGTPIAWNLAGGYRTDADGTIEPVLRIHRNTMAECVRAFVGG